MTYKMIHTPHDTQMLALLPKADERIERHHIDEAIKRLYSDTAQITDIRLNDVAEAPDDSICLDYIIDIQDGEARYRCFNYGCCFLDSSSCIKLYENIEDIHTCLKLLRGHRYLTHPLYYKDYAKALQDKCTLNFS